MTKYIDRYYLNGELYGIKFAEPGGGNRTFTVTWTETADPTQFNPTYSDDAAGLTAGSTDFDEFFGYSAVLLDANGDETAEITQADSGGNGKLDITQLGTLGGGDNVMIKFPIRGVKISRDGDDVTLSITEVLGRESEGYQYFAHNRGDFTTPIIKNNFYIGAYMGTEDDGILKSWSGYSTTGNYALASFISLARANDGNDGSAGYDILGFYQREYINALYMMKYGNPDGKSVIGVGGASIQTTGGTDSEINATYGSSSSVKMKLFGIEDYRGGYSKQILGGVGCVASDGSVYTSLSNFQGTITTNSPREDTGINIVGNGYISSIAGTNRGMFLGTAVNGTSTTYYCDEQLQYQPAICACGDAGPFDLLFWWTSGQFGWDLGTRLMYL